MRTLPLQQRLLQNLLIVILPLGVIVAGTSGLATRTVAEDTARSLTQHSIDQTTAKLELYFASIDRLLGAVRSWTRNGLLAVDDLTAMRQLMQPLLANEPQISSFLIADELGHELMLLQTGDGWRARRKTPEQPGRVEWLRWSGAPDSEPRTTTEARGYDPRNRPWFAAAVAGSARDRDDGGTGEVRWTGPYRLWTTQDPGMTASVAETAPNGRITVVALDVLLLDITAFTRGLALSERGGVVLLDAAGEPIGPPDDPSSGGLVAARAARPQGPAQPGGDHRSLLGAAERAFSNADDGPTQLVRFARDGQPWWGARKAFPLAADQRLWIQVLVPEADLLGPLEVLPYALALFTLMILAAAAWRMQAVSQRFSQPIERLVEASDRLRRGDFRPTPVPTLNIGELEQLALAQERMRLGLEALMRLERDLQVARDIQQATLPQRLPTLVGFELEVWAEPANETGGDTYDAIDLAPDRAGDGRRAEALLFVADATGHGVGPALTATAVRSLLRMAVRTGQGIDDIARHLNDQLYQDLGQGRFVTAWLAEVDTRRRQVRSLSAGQAPILIYRRARDHCEVRSADGPPLGVFPGTAPSAGAWSTLAPGDIVAVISDGIFEAVDPDGEAFGVERTVAAIRAQRDAPAHAIRTALLQELSRFTREHPADDDRTILILKATA